MMPVAANDYLMQIRLKWCNIEGSKKKKKGPASRGRLHNQDDCQARQDEQDLDVCGCTVSSDDDILVDQ